MSFFDKTYRSKNQNIYWDAKRCISIDVKREDQIHPIVSGNKFRKLKYNIEHALSEGHQTLLTYGGAYSNHIAATAAGAKICGIKSIGVIRGEEIQDKLYKNPQHNPTLAYAKEQGMYLHFLTRDSYQKKDTISEIDKLTNKFGSFYRIPEGGTNSLAVKGCEEILDSDDKKYDIICCCVGTGGTIAGIINTTKNHQKVYGFSALKNHEHDEIKNWAKGDNWQIFQDHKFGGYAKTNSDLITFINSFYRCTKIKLDPIYTGKMLFQLFEMINQKHFSENTNILAIHSGGLQGVKGFNRQQIDKSKPSLEF